MVAADTARGLSSKNPPSAKETTAPQAPPNKTLQTAHRLLGKESPLDRQILQKVLGSPARFRELRPLIEGRSDNVLTLALDRLEDEGLIKRRADASGDAVVPRYHVTDFGTQVLATMDLLEEAGRRFTL